jgi:hypothetical protein
LPWWQPASADQSPADPHFLQVAIEQLQQELTASRREEQAIRDEANRVSSELRTKQDSCGALKRTV